MAVGDFNRDGDPDLATANSGTNQVTVLLGDGTGAFTPQATHPQTGSYPYSVAVGTSTATATTTSPPRTTSPTR